MTHIRELLEMLQQIPGLNARIQNGWLVVDYADYGDYIINAAQFTALSPAAKMAFLIAGGHIVKE